MAGFAPRWNIPPQRQGGGQLGLGRQWKPKPVGRATPFCPEPGRCAGAGAPADDRAETILLQLLRGARTRPGHNAGDARADRARPVMAAAAGTPPRPTGSAGHVEDWIWIETTATTTPACGAILRHDIYRAWRKGYRTTEQLLRSVRPAADAATLLDELAASDLS